MLNSILAEADLLMAVNGYPRSRGETICGSVFKRKSLNKLMTPPFSVNGNSGAQPISSKSLKRWWARQGLNLRPHPCEGWE